MSEIEEKRTESTRGRRIKERRLVRGVRRTQDRLARLLGTSAEGRTVLVAAMLQRSTNEVTSYWLQLVVSIGIATLGLVVGSAAVIIGAMLVAPLMGPIIALAMGLATGSPFLVLRSAGRILLSVVVTVGGSAAITVMLPFHELTTEIAGRTSPTALDLLTAGFCALAGVYASLRPGSDTATTAAGTSIGISLVPPLCASGFGIGTSSPTVAGGAALLFLTNLVAIIFVGTLSFVAAGFNRVSATTLERQELAKSQNAVFTAAIARRLAGLFESNAGPVLRFLMPLALLAAVYVPLRRALDEVAWQVRVRAAVHDSLQRQKQKIVQTRVRVERHEVDLLVVIVGKTADAEISRAGLEAELEKAAGVAPRVEVLAIPDSTAFAGLESSLHAARDPLSLPPPSPTRQLDGGRELVRAGVARVWPTAAAGEPLMIDVDATQDAPLRVRIVHLGEALSADAIESVNRAMGATLDRDVAVMDVPVPALPLTRARGDLRLVADASAGVRASAAIASVNVCVVEPSRSNKKKARIDRRDEELAKTLRTILAAHPRVAFTSGSEWLIRFTTASCSGSTSNE